MVPAAGQPQGVGVVHIEPAPESGRNLVTFVGDDFVPPDRIAPGATTYVVWVRPPDGAVENVGPLRVDESGHAEITINTPYDSFTLLITAEPNAAVVEPLGRAVFTMGANTD